MYKITSIALLLLCGCEPFYDPVETGDAPSSPGTSWDQQAIEYRETAVNPYNLSDLSGTMPLSLLLDMALYNNPTTRYTWNAARSAAYGYRASLSDYYPALSYEGSLSAQTTKGTDFATSGGGIVATPGAAKAPKQSFLVTTSNSLTLSYLLLDFGGRSATAEIALQTLFASNWQHNLAMQQVMLSVLNAYTNYIGNEALVESYTQNLKDAETALKASTVMHAAGLATLSDVLLSQSTLEQTRTYLLQAQGAEKTALGEVLIAVGLSPDANVSLEQLPQKLPVIEISGNISDLLALAKENNPNLGIAIAAIKEQEAQLALSYSNSMPTLSTVGNWNQVRFISPKMPSGYKETASLVLSFPIFQGYYYLNQQRQFRAQIEEALANLDVQLATIYTQVVTNYYAFTAAEAALPSSEAAVQASERAFRGYVVQYRTGSSSILDMLTALTTLSSARAQLVVTRTQWANALANLAFSVGVLQDTSGNWLEAPPEKLYHLPTKDDKKGEQDLDLYNDALHKLPGLHQ